MHPVISFFTGLFSLGASFGMACKEQSGIERQAREDDENHYSYAAQSQYDFNRGKLYMAYDIPKIMEGIHADYPRMNDFCARQVAEAAVAKKMLEEETPYKYKPSENCKYFDLDKYVNGDEHKQSSYYVLR